MLTKLISTCCVLVFLIFTHLYLPQCTFSQVAMQDNTSSLQTGLFDDKDFSLQDEENVPELDMKKLLARVVLMLVLMLVGIVAVVWMLKSFLGGKDRLFSKQERYLQVVDRMYLDNKKVVYLIKILDEILILGGTSDHVNLLDKITDPQKVEALASREFAPLMSLFHKKTDTEKEQSQ